MTQLAQELSLQALVQLLLGFMSVKRSCEQLANTFATAYNAVTSLRDRYMTFYAMLPQFHSC